MENPSHLPIVAVLLRGASWLPRKGTGLGGSKALTRHANLSSHHVVGAFAHQRACVATAIHSAVSRLLVIIIDASPLPLEEELIDVTTLLLGHGLQRAVVEYQQVDGVEGGCS